VLLEVLKQVYITCTMHIAHAHANACAVAEGGKCEDARARASDGACALLAP
jgi:hypothetical protein